MLQMSRYNFLLQNIIRNVAVFRCLHSKQSASRRFPTRGKIYTNIYTSRANEISYYIYLFVFRLFYMKRSHKSTSVIEW